MAPGMISVEARSQFFYRPLGESANIKVCSDCCLEKVVTCDLAPAIFFQYGSTSSIETALGNAASNELSNSIDHLREQLYNGDLVLAFRDLPRQQPGATVDAAQLDENQPKNRYCNVLPYDFNRVLLQRRGGATSDYVNASLIVIRLPGDATGRNPTTDLKYIATQVRIVRSFAR